MRITESKLKQIIRESLKSDVRRHEIARKFYNYVLDGVKSARRGTLSAAEGRTLFYTPGKEIVMSARDDDVRIFIDVSKMPEEMSAELNPQGPDPAPLENVAIYLHADTGGAGGRYHPSPRTRAERLIEIYVEKGVLQLSGLSSFEQHAIVMHQLTLKRTTLIHEIAHMFDELALMGSKAFNVSSPSPWRGKKIEQDLKSKDNAAAWKRYYKLGYEVNARWVQVLDELDPLPYTGYDPKDDRKFNEWLDRAKKEIRFENLPVAKQRKFVGKLWDLFKSGPHELPHQRVEEEAQRLVKKFKERGQAHETWEAFASRALLGREISKENLVRSSGDWQERFSKKNSEKILERAAELAKPAEPEPEPEA